MKDLMATSAEWRLRNLYRIRDWKNREVVFRPNIAQQRLIDTHVERLRIIKARKVGVMTVMTLKLLDSTLFTGNCSARVIARDKPHADAIFKNYILYPYRQLPNSIRCMTEVVGNTIRSENGSTLRVVLKDDIERADYIYIPEYNKLGGENLVLEGVNMVIDGVGGLGWGDVGSFETIFFPWHDASMDILENSDMEICEEDSKYFDGLEDELGKKLTIEQRRWYITNRNAVYAGAQNREMKDQFPSTLTEALSYEF